MNRKYLILLLNIFLISFAAKAQLQDSLTLQQCIDVALNNNLQVKQSQLNAESTHINYQQAKENLLPAINGSINHDLSNGRSLDPTTYNYVNQQLVSATYNLQGSLILFNGFSLLNNIKQAKLSYEAGKMDFQQAKDVVTINVITAYLQVLNNADLVVQANAQVEVSRQTLQRTEILNKNGAVKPSDLYDIQGQLAADKLAVINAQNTLEVSKLALLQVMNVAYQKDIQLQHFATNPVLNLYPLNADEVYKMALSDLALVKSATLKRQSAEKAVSVARGALFPTLALYGGLYTNYSNTQQVATLIDSVQVPTGAFTRKTPNGPVDATVYAYQNEYANHRIPYGNQLKNNYNSSVSVGLTLPIFNFFQKRNNVALAKINVLNAKYTEENIKIQLKQSVEQAYVNMTSAYSRYQVLLDQVRAFTESFRTAQIRYDAGVLTSVDYVVIKNKLDQANTNLIISKYDYAIRTKILDYYQGKL